MAIILQGTSTNVGSTSAVSITHGLTINEGDVVVAYLFSNGTDTGITDNNGSFPFIEDFDENGPQTSQHSVYSRVAGDSEPSSYEWTLGSSQNWSLIVLVYSGVDSSVWDVAPVIGNENTGSSGDATAPTIATLTDDAVALAFYGVDTSTNIAYSVPTNGYVIDVQEPDSRSIAVASKTITSAGATGSAAVELSVARDWSALHAALKPKIASQEPVIEDTGSGPNGITGSNVDCNAPTGLQEGELFLQFIGGDDDDYTWDEPANADFTTLVKKESGFGGGSASVYSAWKIATDSEPAQNIFTRSGTNEDFQSRSIRISGIDPAKPIGVVSNFLTGSGTTATAPAITASNSKSKILRFIAVDTASITSSVGGLTGVFNAAGGNGLCAIAVYEESSLGLGASTETQDFTLSITDDWIAWTIEILPKVEQVILPLPKQFHPDFAAPLDKPLGNNIKLDLSHRLTEGTLAYFALNNSYKTIGGKWGAIGEDVNFAGGVGTFNGTSSRIEIADNPALEGLSKLTIHTRIIIAGTPSANETIVAKHHNNSSLRAYRLNVGTDRRVRFAVNTTTALESVLSTTQLVVGQLYDVTGSYDGVNLRIYIDGVDEHNIAKSGTIITNDSPFTVGCRYKTTYEEFFNGTIYYVHMLEEGFTSSEVLRYKNAPYQILEPTTPIYFPVVLRDPLTYLPLPKQFHPDFITPFSKPASQVLLDTENSVSKGLMRSYLHNGNFVDITRGKLAVGAGSLGYKEGFLTFDGASDITESSGTTGDLNTGVMSVYARFRLDDATNVFFSVANYLTGSFSDGWLVQRDVATQDWEFRLRLGGTNYRTFSTNSTVVGEWISLVGTYDGETVRLYVNDDPVVINTAPSGNIPDITGALNIGSFDGSSEFFSGEIDTVSIWDRVLGEAEIKSLVLNPKQILAPASPVYYPVVVTAGEVPSGPITGSFAVSMEQYLSAMSGLQKLTQSMTSALGDLGGIGNGSFGGGVDGDADYLMGDATFSANTNLKLTQNLSVPFVDVTGAMNSKITVPGASAFTFEGLVSESTNTLILTSTLDSTLINNEFSASTNQLLSGTIAENLTDVGFQGSNVKLSLTGTLAPNLSDVIDAATAEMAQVGAGNFNLEMMSQTNTGTLTIVGTQNFGLNNLTFANSLDGRLIGVFAATLGSLLYSHTTAQKMSGALSPTLTGGTSTQAGAQSLTTTIDKELLNTLASVTSELIMQNSLNVGMNDILSTSTSTATLVGTLSKVLSDITSINAIGNARIGSLNSILAGITSDIDTNLFSNGTLVTQLENDSVSNTSGQKTQGVLNTSLEDYSSALSTMLKLIGGINLDLLDVELALSIEGVLGSLPVTDLMYFNSISSGWLAQSLMKIYNKIVDGDPYGAKDLRNEMIIGNKIQGRYEWSVKFASGYLLTVDSFPEFTFEFAKAVSEGQRLVGNTHTERESYLVTYMPLTFSSVWQVPFKL